MQIITWRGLKILSTLSDSTLKRSEKTDPDFPPKIQLSANRVGFEEEAAHRWLKLLAKRTLTIFVFLLIGFVMSASDSTAASERHVQTVRAEYPQGL